jgi:hypothetical protein
VGEKLGVSFNELLAPARLSQRDPIARISFGLTQFLTKAIGDPVWPRLVIQSAHAPTEFLRNVRSNLKADLTEAKAQGRMVVQDVELAADIAWASGFRSSPSGWPQRRHSPNRLRRRRAPRRASAMMPS